MEKWQNSFFMYIIGWECNQIFMQKKKVLLLAYCYLHQLSSSLSLSFCLLFLFKGNIKSWVDGGFCIWTRFGNKERKKKFLSRVAFSRQLATWLFFGNEECLWIDSSRPLPHYPQNRKSRSEQLERTNNLAWLNKLLKSLKIKFQLI